MFGAKINPQTTQEVQAKATPAGGNSAEVIWHQLYDTQSYVSGTTIDLNFFQSTQNGDTTLTNMQSQGVLPLPQTFQIFDITLDVLSIIPLSTNPGATTVVGVLNDLALLIFGANQRPTWTFIMSEKKYGPYSLTVLHGTGGPSGFGWGAEVASLQYARNEPSPGWNYMGNITIPQQISFNIALHWAAAATMTEDKRLRVSMFGILNRRVS